MLYLYNVFRVLAYVMLRSELDSQGNALTLAGMHLTVLSPLIFFNFLGFTSNREFNSVRARGNCRPVNVLEIRRIARKKYARLGKKHLMAMLIPKGKFIVCAF